MAKNGDAEHADLVLYKGHEFIHISNQVTITQRKLMNVLLYHAYDSLITQEEHTITIPELMRLMEYETNNYDFLKEAFRALVDVKFEWNLLGLKEETWGIATALSQAEINGNVCKYSYAPKVREKLFNPEIYGAINLRIQNKFGSKYSLALYENCSRFRMLSKTTWLSIPTLRQLLGVPDNSYRGEFKIFNREVLKPAVAEVNQVTDQFQIEPEFQRESRKIVAVRFLIANKQQSLPDLSEVDPVILKRLEDYGLIDSVSRSMAGMYSADYINAVLDYVDDQVAKKKVKDVPAYTVGALKEGWMKKDTKFVKEKREKEELEKNAKLYEQEMANVRQAFSDFRRDRLIQIRESMSEDELDELRREFLSGLMPHEVDLFKRSGFDSAIIQNQFNSFIARKYLTKPEEIDMDAFIKYHGFKLQANPAQVK